MYLYTRKLAKFNTRNFLLDFLRIDWNEVISLEDNNPNQSFILF